MSSNKASRSYRRLDAESGMNRVSSSKKPAKAKQSPPSDDEYASSDSELESALDIPAKDDSRRRKTRGPAPARKGKKDGRTRDFKGEEDDHSDLDQEKAVETDNKIAPHRQVLLASTYHIGVSSVSRPAVSSFIPSAVNYFMMVYAISNILVENTLLHEMCPSFFTPALSLYFGHVYFYQVLRARSAAGSDVLTRLEKRALTYYERVGEPESWPIPAPLLGFLEYFGAHKTEDPYFTWIVPALPSLSALSNNSLRNMSTVPGITRIPLIPALQQFVHNFGAGLIEWNDEVLYPVATPLSETNQFVGLNASTAATASFQTLAFSAAWLIPCETENDIGPYDLSTKQSRIRRWNVPAIANDENFSSLSSFLGFKDDASFNWMKNLLTMAEVCCRFFPGSGSLGSVSPLTTLSVATRSYYRSNVARIPGDNVWYHDHAGWHLSFKGYTNTETGILDTKMSLTVSPNATYAISVIPAICGNSAPQLCGPYFLNDPQVALNFEIMAVPVTEGSSTQDPSNNFQQLASRQYDNKAGR
uniref:Putative coat protein n=1 Tax=Erysiphe necator partitivirus 1 TaxID=2052564 RepID=A0A2I5ARE8_9VIRU|nr:putative coat protein [Erysiphe necator partitivirus 1]